ncbi:MAG: hypothetical protein N5P05_002226 [Chroococcopsis gigantea SAG 12.99]|jgi:hypothetical protein|nr:hypothetical protein [Chroococcopsis gigantea SAG 12.99]
MFLEELQPVVKELIQQPLAFLGGFISGALRLNPNEDPLKKWLEQQGIVVHNSTTSSNGNSPQSISID